MAVSNGNPNTNGHGSSRAAKYDLPAHFIGGNHLEVAAPSNVKDFVDQHDGHSVISSVSRHPGIKSRQKGILTNT